MRVAGDNSILLATGGGGRMKYSCTVFAQQSKNQLNEPQSNTVQTKSNSKQNKMQHNVLLVQPLNVSEMGGLVQGGQQQGITQFYLLVLDVLKWRKDEI